MNDRDEVAILAAGPAHAAVLAELHAAAFSDASDAWTADSFTSLLAMPGATAWLAQSPDQSPVGFALSRTGGGECEIIVICVNPASRKRGVAKQLLATILAAALEAQVPVILKVAEDNPAALSLYDAAGFSQVGRRRDYYQRSSGRTDALILRWGD